MSFFHGVFGIDILYFEKYEGFERWIIDGF